MHMTSLCTICGDKSRGSTPVVPTDHARKLVNMWGAAKCFKELFVKDIYHVCHYGDPSLLISEGQPSMWAHGCSYKHK
jgi:hypothetical protein